MPNVANLRKFLRGELSGRNNFAADCISCCISEFNAVLGRPCLLSLNFAAGSSNLLNQLLKGSDYLYFGQLQSNGPYSFIARKRRHSLTKRRRLTDRSQDT
ncbi:hypothetical protein L596_022012 [Steinernema carpocapsae]|uniref:Uncharacterized protein n=1 Tax=Steinernema carpocapsae TaxID=34508 RepID=A0A4U5MKJ0_STECR|nr:hypothetical protein L596_022012 [Steinernema carpocapsae]